MKVGAKMSIPPLFRCPISLELFTDPVTLCTGQTYDRPCIERWISSGNLTCPVTMLRLHDLSMVPNHTLTHLIHLWLNQTTHNTPLLGPTDDPHGAYLAALKQTLESQEPIWEEKLQALRQVKALTLELPERENECLIRFGFFQVLIKLGFDELARYFSFLTKNPSSNPVNGASLETHVIGPIRRKMDCTTGFDRKKMGFEIECTHHRLELVELALTSAVKLMPFISDLECLNVLKKRSNLTSLAILLEQGTPLIKILICYILEALLSSSSHETKEVRAMIRASPDIQRSVINLTLALDQDACEQEAGVKVITSFCLKGPEEDTALENLVHLGAIKGLTRHILRHQGTDGGSAVAAVEALEVLLAVEGGKEALLGEPNGVKVLVKMVFRVSDHQGCESAVNALVGVCGSSEEAREEAVKAGVLTQLLLLMQSQCSCQAKAKATALLRMLGTVCITEEPVK